MVQVRRVGPLGRSDVRRMLCGSSQAVTRITSAVLG